MAFDFVNGPISKRRKTTVPANDRRFSSLALGVAQANPSTPTKLFLPDPSVAWLPGTTFSGFTSTTTDASGPFSGQSIQFRGTHDSSDVTHNRPREAKCLV
jgi:hypothetical protein